MRGSNPGRQLAYEIYAFLLGYPADPAEQSGEVLAVHILHGHIVLAVELPDVIDPAYIRMGNLACDPHLVLEQCKSGFVSPEPARQELQGHGLTKLQVIGPVDLTHPAAAQQAYDSITLPELSAREKATMLACRIAVMKMFACSLGGGLSRNILIVTAVSCHSLPR
jgi:hypothetical protein